LLAKRHSFLCKNFSILLYCIVCTFIVLNNCYIQILRRSILAVINESSPVHITWPPVKGSPCHFILKWGIPVNFLTLKCGVPHRVAKSTIFIKSLVWPGRGSNQRPPGLEADTTTEPPSRYSVLQQMSNFIVLLYKTVFTLFWTHSNGNKYIFGLFAFNWNSRSYLL
jgi:hypothetical protein